MTYKMHDIFLSNSSINSECMHSKATTIKVAIPVYIHLSKSSEPTYQLAQRLDQDGRDTIVAVRDALLLQSISAPAQYLGQQTRYILSHASGMHRLRPGDQ